MKKIILFITMFCSTVFIFAQNQVKLTMSACNSTESTFDFDLLVSNEGVDPMILQGIEVGITFDYYAIGAVNLKIQYLLGSSQLNAQQSNYTNTIPGIYSPSLNPNYTVSSNNIHSFRFGGLNGDCLNGTPLPQCSTITVPPTCYNLRVGTFRVSNFSGVSNAPSTGASPKPWTPNSNPNLAFWNTFTGGFNPRQTLIHEYYNGACTTAVTLAVVTPPPVCSISSCIPLPQVFETPCSNAGLILNRTCNIPTTPMHAGVGEVLTITPMLGQGFGGPLAIGDVKLIDASNTDPNTDSTYALDINDWSNPNNPNTPWDNLMIQVVLPSFSYKNGGSSGLTANPGSGKVRVKDKEGNIFTSITDLNIEYSISNALIWE